jgi:hypothetical protein
MQRLYPFLGDTEPAGSNEFLTRQATGIQERHLSGFIELRVSESIQAVLLYAHGNYVGTYLVENGQSRRIANTDLGTVWNGAPTPIRTVRLADPNSRIAWLALESSAKSGMQIQDAVELEREIQKWKAENALGLIELSSEMGQGFAVIRPGEFLPMESVFLDPAGNEKGFLAAFSASRQWTCSISEIHSSSNAFTCFALRQGALRWGNSTLTRFGDVAGLKFLHSTTQALKSLIDTWRWQMSVTEAGLADAHFFAQAETSAQAYRAIFMTIGAQMEFVIGNHLSQRILAEMFRQLRREERTALEAHRLIPAAFTD